MSRGTLSSAVIKVMRRLCMHHVFNQRWLSCMRFLGQKVRTLDVLECEAFCLITCSSGESGCSHVPCILELVTAL